MTTIVYTEEIMTSKSPNSGAQRNIKTFTVKIMGDAPTETRGSPKHSTSAHAVSHKKKLSVKQKPDTKLGKQQLEFQSSFPPGYNPHTFYINAYLPHDGGRRLTLKCTPGQTVQDVIETKIPDISRTGYQVYQFPSKALLNKEKDVRVLQDQEISIEPMRECTPDSVDDDRFSVVRELLKSEDTYLENLRNIFDIYMEPLKKWGLPQDEMNTMFRPLSRLCDLLMNFFSELEMAVQYWNTNSTKIGGLFKQYRSFWDMYKEYSINYAKACKLLKDKRAMDESFNRFIEMKRGAAMHTLESLMLLPVQRIYEYHKLLLRLYNLTPVDHPDYHDLRYTVTCVGSMVQARDQQINLCQNETKLEQVQARFPNDDLHLTNSIEVIEQTTRRSSQRNLKHRKSDSFGSSMDQSDGGASERKKSSIRLYLAEGPVKIISGLQSHERYFFLFDDMLIIAKPIGKQKSPHKFYKRKEQIRLSDMWVTDCVDEVMETTLPPNTSFIIGWPVLNFVAAFSTPGEKSLWFDQLSKCIVAQRQALQPDRVSIQIVNLTKSSNNIPVWMQVHSCEKAKGVLLRALELLAIAVAESNCQMWVKLSKDDQAYPLVGHEHPFVIQTFHNRHQLEFLGEHKPTQLQFVIRRKSAISTPTEVSSSRPRLKRQTFSFSQWWNKRQGRDGSTRHKYRVFKAPLGEIIANNQLPEVLQEMLIQLYSEGPKTLGIFRQSANYRKVKEYKETIDNREPVDLSSVSIHVVAALLKDLLRSVPGGILMSSRYTEFVATNDVKDPSTRVLHIQKVLSKLPDENFLFLRYLIPLLHHISINEETNCMNSINLAICFSPSLLWPDSGLDVIKNEVPPLVQFMIEHSPEIFGEELPELYKQAAKPSSPGVVQMEYAMEQQPLREYIPTKVEDGDGGAFIHKRSDSIDSSMSETSLPDDAEQMNLIRARKSGLTLSDSQLSVSQMLEDEEEEEIEYDPPVKPVREMYGKHPHPKVNMMLQTNAGRPQAKRVKKIRKPERSSSLRGPNDAPPHKLKRVRVSGDATTRRKSIAVQTTLHRKQPFMSEFAPISASPNSSFTSSQGYSPKQFRPLDKVDETPDVYRGSYSDSPPKHGFQKKRRLAQHSHSFSKGSENKPTKPTIPTSASTSFYDKLLPLDPQDARARSRSMGNTLGMKNCPEELEEQIPERTEWCIGEEAIRQPVVKLPQPLLITHSSQSLASSSRSGSIGSFGSQKLILTQGQGMTQQQPKTTTSGQSSSLVSSRATPDQFSIAEHYAVSEMDYTHSTPTTTTQILSSGPISSSTPYNYSQAQQKREQMAKFHKQETFSGDEDSLDRVQKKFHERKRIDSTASNASDCNFSKSPSYQSFLTSQQKKDSLMSLTEESGIDDRPESDQHLHSLPRPHTAEFVRPEHKAKIVYPPQQEVDARRMLPVGVVLEAVPDHDPNKLYPTSSGYNSDTESSPSRTLSRPGKIKEVTTPTKTTIPMRYQKATFGAKRSDWGNDPHFSSVTHHQQYHQSFTPSSDAVHTKLSKAEPLSSSSSLHIQESMESLIEDVALSSEQTQDSSSENATGIRTVITTARRSDSSKVEKLTEIFQQKELERRDSGVIEDSKVKLGLIPTRQRSRSTSEKEVMRIIHKIPEEDEQLLATSTQASRTTTTTLEEERAEKHKVWPSSTSIVADRKKPWEQLSKTQFQRLDGPPTRTLHTEGGGPSILHTTTKKSLTPEMKRKSSTMPEYLITRSKAAGGSMVRTLKISSYEVPEPKKIRRINLRTYH